MKIKNSSLFEILNSFSESDLEGFKSKPISKEFWENHEKLQKELELQHKKEQELIRMSPEKFRTPFTI